MSNSKSLWGLQLFAGVLWILLGSVALFLPVVTTFSAIFVFGWVLIIAGIVQCIVVLFNWSSEGGVFFLLGILSLIFGSILVMNLFSGVIAITSLIGVMFLLQSVLMLLAGLFTNKVNWLLLVAGSISLVGAILILGNLMASSIFLVGLLMGVYMITYGFALVAESTFEANNASEARKVLGWLLVAVIAVMLIAGMVERPKVVISDVVNEVEQATE